MIEAMLESSPENAKLLELAAEAYAQYAFGFVEDQAEEAAPTDLERAKQLRRRAHGLFMRSARYGSRLLAQHNARFPAAVFGPETKLREALSAVDRDAVSGVFWTGFALAGAINTGKDDPSVIAFLPKVEALLMRAEQLDPKFQNGGALLGLGAYWASRTKFFGGDPDKGRKYFERAMKDHPQFAMIRVMFARTYAVQTQDRALYERLLREVLDANPDSAPNVRLANEIARRRARRYLAEIDDLFEGGSS
jgi:predicted anti-sigma-YlaC factor YlaD